MSGTAMGNDADEGEWGSPPFEREIRAIVSSLSAITEWRGIEVDCRPKLPSQPLSIVLPSTDRDTIYHPSIDVSTHGDWIYVHREKEGGVCAGTRRFHSASGAESVRLATRAANPFGDELSARERMRLRRCADVLQHDGFSDGEGGAQDQGPPYEPLFAQATPMEVDAAVSDQPFASLQGYGECGCAECCKDLTGFEESMAEHGKKYMETAAHCIAFIVKAEGECKWLTCATLPLEFKYVTTGGVLPGSVGAVGDRVYAQFDAELYELQDREFAADVTRLQIGFPRQEQRAAFLSWLERISVRSNHTQGRSPDLVGLKDDVERLTRAVASAARDNGVAAVSLTMTGVPLRASNYPSFSRDAQTELQMEVFEDGSAVFARIMLEDGCEAYRLDSPYAAEAVRFAMVANESLPTELIAPTRMRLSIYVAELHGSENWRRFRYKRGVRSR